MRHFTRIAESVDTAPLLAELDAAPEMWLADTSRQRSRHPRRAAYRAGMVLELRHVFQTTRPHSQFKPENGRLVTPWEDLKRIIRPIRQPASCALARDTN